MDLIINNWGWISSLLLLAIGIFHFRYRMKAVSLQETTNKELEEAKEAIKGTPLKSKQLDSIDIANNVLVEALNLASLGKYTEVTALISKELTAIENRLPAEISALAHKIDELNSKLMFSDSKFKQALETQNWPQLDTQYNLHNQQVEDLFKLKVETNSIFEKTWSSSN